MASSCSSSSFASCKYDVFLSFRGEDTRDNFTSHLAAALCRKKLEIFIDESLQRGDEISPALLNAIETSKISVIIFSKSYASSRWCLDELVKILECHKINGQIVIPVFYHVDPSNVRKQTGSCGKAFVELAKRFKKMPENVQRWRAVLTDASNLSGWDSAKIKSEAELVDEIVKDVLKKLENMSVSNDLEGFVGLHSRIEEIKSLLQMGLPDFRIVGIWGMGGIGKTTIAEAIFNQTTDEFEGKSLIANVREESERVGLVHLRNRLLSGILEEDIKIETHTLPEYIRKRLQRMKVFIILDDVNTPEQLEFLSGRLDRFSPGSRIIVTTRDKQVLQKCGVSYIYEVQRLNPEEANELFCNFAFRKDHYSQDLHVLSKRVRHYASGNPLALQVLGSSLYQLSKEEWEDMLHKLQRILNPRIYDVLKVSYGELTSEEQNIFLDIACFFKGDDKNHVTRILGDRYSVHSAVNALVNKSLITISDNKLQMHNLLQEMGWEIVRQECEKEPAKRSRLWYHEDICHVLKKNKGTNAIEGIFLNLSKIRNLNLDSKAFSKMSHLRLLKFYMPEYFGVSDLRCGLHIPHGLEYLSDELRYLCWHGYPLRTLPMNFSPENLIELSMPCSKLEQLWEGKKEAFKLKSIDLQHSQYLSSIPDLSETPNLERVNLLNCINLSCISSSIQNFNNLRTLSLKDCKSLRCFPPNIHFRSPIDIDLSFCVNFTEFPQISGKIMKLNLGGTAIEEVPSSVEILTDLQILDMRLCKRLKVLSTSICKLKSLCELHLGKCSKLDSFPEILEKMEHLGHIDLQYTAVKGLPSSIKNVEGLQSLILRGCSEIDTLPENLGNLKSLFGIAGEKSAIGQLPRSLTDLSKLQTLSFSGCRGLILPPLSGLSNLRNLDLDDCDIMEIPQNIGCLSSLEWLNLKGNNFESLPTSIKQLSQLRSLCLSNCNMLQSLPELPPSLFRLKAANCKRLQYLPELPSSLEELDKTVLEKLSKRPRIDFSHSRELDFSNCMRLNENTNNDILANSQQRIRYMATALLSELFYEKETSTSYQVSLCLPGSGIPEWFSNQSSGSSINCQLPKRCCNRNFIGFALCAVIEFEEVFHTRNDFGVKCIYGFETGTFSETDQVGRMLKLKNTVPGEIDYIYDSDHVYLGFDSFLADGDHKTAVSVDFYITGIEKAKVKRCGVCPLYAHPIETKPNAFTVHMLPPCEEECRKFHNQLHDKTGTNGTTTEAGRISRSDAEKIKAPQEQNLFLSQIFRCLGLRSYE